MTLRLSSRRYLSLFNPLTTPYNWTPKLLSVFPKSLCCWPAFDKSLLVKRRFHIHLAMKLALDIYKEL